MFSSRTFNLSVALCTTGLFLVLGYTFLYAYNEDIESENRAKIDDKLNSIYDTLREMEGYHYCLSDTQIRNFHYAKPHTTPMSLCSECSDLAENKNTGSLVSVPIDRLEELRSFGKRSSSLPIPQDQALAAQPDETLTVNEELDAVLFLLKSQKTHLYTSMYTEELTHHYLKKHKHESPGEHGKCPECLSLRKKQTTVYKFVSRVEYDKLLELEKKHKSNAKDSR